MTNKDLIKKINRKILSQNKEGRAIIFFITGLNSTGKTTISRYLIRNLEFFQTINLGIVSKLIRFFIKEEEHSKLENFSSFRSKKLFSEIIDFIIDHYYNSGVNIIIEGVQIDPGHLEKNKKVTGGIILSVKDDIIYSRNINPTSRFKRVLKKIEKHDYIENNKFIKIENNLNVLRTFKQILLSLDRLIS